MAWRADPSCLQRDSQHMSVSFIKVLLVLLALLLGVVAALAAVIVCRVRPRNSAASVYGLPATAGMAGGAFAATVTLTLYGLSSMGLL